MGKSSENKRNLASLAALAQDAHRARQELTALRGELGLLLWLGGSGTRSLQKTTPCNGLAKVY